MDIWKIFTKKGEHLFWQRLEKDQIDQDNYEEFSIENDQAYFLVRLKEMYIRNTRILWRKYYPLLHGFVHYGGKEDHAVAGPGQLKELGEANLDRVITLNYRLCGPIAYKGGDVQVLLGLYSVPAEEALGLLINMVSQVATLGGLAVQQAAQIANTVKKGVEDIIGMNEARLELGLNDTFYQHNPFRAGYYVGIKAPKDQIAVNRLWLVKGRLMKGEYPQASKSFEDYDYFVMEIERRLHRDDWPGLPGIAEMQGKFAGVMRDPGLQVTQKRERLRDLWPEFTQTLGDSPFLVKPDREQIANDVSQDLKNRLQSLETGNPFETRAWGEASTVRRDPAVFDFLDVEQYLDWQDQEGVRRARQALAGNPFQI